jgi:hypothetical protein
VERMNVIASIENTAPPRPDPYKAYWTLTLEDKMKAKQTMRNMQNGPVADDPPSRTKLAHPTPSIFQAAHPPKGPDMNKPTPTQANVLAAIKATGGRVVQGDRWWYTSIAALERKGFITWASLTSRSRPPASPPRLNTKAAYPTQPRNGTKHEPARETRGHRRQHGPGHRHNVRNTPQAEIRTHKRPQHPTGKKVLPRANSYKGRSPPRL